MTDPHLFWTIFGAVLGAIILGGTFFWGLIAYTKHENRGTAGRRESHGAALACIGPLAFLALVLYAIF